ncbi:hypothetical protein [Spirosoma oryzicola]|uniref:hypothetical protein n=1 Tax=Spirosoma oryzicola TaxID=2898794 RepID=UPI001E342FD2|nr:hypothetical protein [Spirosoma oryzicola]UHG93413.1 hypothetical protein LQ777_11025 [Spirosoma oryzicola]
MSIDKARAQDLEKSIEELRNKHVTWLEQQLQVKDQQIDGYLKSIEKYLEMIQNLIDQNKQYEDIILHLQAQLSGQEQEDMQAKEAQAEDDISNLSAQ